MGGRTNESKTKEQAERKRERCDIGRQLKKEEREHSGIRRQKQREKRKRFEEIEKADD